jgi:hypothetical protein
MKKTFRSLVTATVLGVGSLTSALAANMILNNIDAPGVGFNDPTPAAPEGGNAGTTVGEQRLIAYRKALELWGKTLRSDVTIVVRGSFAPRTCTATSGVLASAGALQIFGDFPNAPLTGHWYHVALANALAGEDLTPGPLDVPGPADPFNDDIQAFFNGDIGKPNCLAGSSWYYGLDNNAPAGRIDFLDTFMHEVAHGLGFSNFANEATGGTPDGFPDVYMANTRDLTNGRQWNTFTAPEIAASAVRNGKVVWTGPNVTANQWLVLGPYEGLRVTGTLTRELEFGTASFGAAPSVTNLDGAIAIATDDVAAAGGGTVTDGCEPIASNVQGKVALIDRGLCGFAVKVKNAQNAGATAVIIANTLGRTAAGMGGTDPTITIPAVMIGNADADAIRAALPGVDAEYFVDPSRRAGSAEGYVRLYAPTTVALGSSISHFDTVASPSLLMEPFINSDLRSARNLDLTPSLMVDIGWQLETLKIGSCDTGVPNALPNGELLHIGVEACAASASNRGRFVSCVSKLTDSARDAGLLPVDSHGAVQRCAARAR